MKAQIDITGASGTVIERARAKVRLTVSALDGSQPIEIIALCVNRIGIRTPSAPVPDHSLPHLDELATVLADPTFRNPGVIDLLLGVDVCSIVNQGQIRRVDRIVAESTSFGWVLSGQTTPSCPRQVSRLVACQSHAPCSERLDYVVQQLWNLESIPTSSRSSVQDAVCEEIFSTHSRTDDGRYVVRLPLKSEVISLLGDSLRIAISSLRSTHRRLATDGELLSAYVRFMNEYEQLGHMTRLTDDELSKGSQPVHYIVHHGIWQHSDGGKRLRVVFNASRPTSSGYSLNDALHPGPSLQADLSRVLTRWRRHRYVFCADIVKMFRQILVSDRESDLQRIVWSPEPDSPVGHYRLNTVTYGTASAPYLSQRVLRQLCQDEGGEYPQAVSTIQHDTYADDILTGSESLQSARSVRDEVIGLLKAGGFPLKKWIANDPALLDDLPASDLLRPTWKQLSSDGPVKELGVHWDPVSDSFKFPVRDLDPHCTTKRKILGEIAKVFDPCGWIAPALLTAKLLLQDAWMATADWDELLPPSLLSRWSATARDLTNIQQVKLPRWLRTSSQSSLQLHAFADASQRAMAAVVYARVTSQSGRVYVTILAAKTKLSPLRSLRTKPNPRMTIPRLELRATLLAAHLLRWTASELNVESNNCFAWTDSEIVTGWLRSSSRLENCLVENYVAHIQELLPRLEWLHVPTETNPADVSSRGCSVVELVNDSQWWGGPTWLSSSPESWPSVPTEQRVVLTTKQLPEPSMLDKFSRLELLQRFVVRFRRWIRLRLQRLPTRPVLSAMTHDELRAAYLACVRASQGRSFHVELQLLKRGQTLPRRHALYHLDPFLDFEGILRVGGRLQHAELSYDQRHPVILSRNCRLSALVVDWAHRRVLHGSVRLTYLQVLRRAWIVQGRALVKIHIRRCVPCARDQSRPSAPPMAALPAARVTPSRPFSKTGVDYAGPFWILPAKGRGNRANKGYVAVFVCLSTKSLHLEPVGDLTTESFLGALSRFCDRRGNPAEIWSDNGTNFVGADRCLREVMDAIQRQSEIITTHLAEEGIKWCFIPPGAPHFGGLWEAGVKSFKSHLRRVLGPRKLTYEEFSTLLAHIEGVLNSRPLENLQDSPDDVAALTAGHLLVGTPLLTIPNLVGTENPDRLTHWALVKSMRDSFWAKWSCEYLNTIRQRSKWHRSKENLRVGDLVVVQDPSLFSVNGRWPLGRVSAVHPGADGVVRVVRVRTASGEYTRPVVKLALILRPDPSSASAPKFGDPSVEQAILSGETSPPDPPQMEANIVPGTRRAGCSSADPKSAVRGELVPSSTDADRLLRGEAAPRRSERLAAARRAAEL